MKSFEQLVQAAYAAYCKQAVIEDEEGLAIHATPWDQLDPGSHACWTAATKQVVAEVTAIR